MIDAQALVQTESGAGLFGMRPDGTVDENVAADQMTEMLAKLAGPSNPLTGDEKNVLHDLISGFAKAFNPTKETTQNLQKDFEQLVNTFAAPASASKMDEKLGATNLLGLFSGGSQQAFDTKLLADLTEKFLSSMEKQFKVWEQVKPSKNI